MTDKRGKLLYLLYALFFLSGISGLVYQIVWTRMLVLVFGNTMLATSTVLSAFMGGLAAGSYVLGLHVDRRPRNLLRLYAGLEALVGVMGLLFPLLLSGVAPIYSRLYQALEGDLVVLNLIRFGACFLLISLPTFLMGGTLPVLLKLFAGDPKAIGRQTGILYGLNTAGSVAGTIACGYLLLKALGMRQTTWVAVAINLVVALAAWAISTGPARSARRAGSSEAEGAPAESRQGPAGAKPIHAAGGIGRNRTSTGVAAPRMDPTTRLVLLGIGISGFCALAYEVFWTRMLNLFVHNNIYSFTAILATFLAGIALGSLIYSRFLSRIADQVRVFIILEIGIGILSYATPFIFSILLGIFSSFSETMTIVKTSLIMIAPTVLMGISLPLTVQVCQRGAHREGTSVGTVYAINTVGSILGAFVAGFILLPAAGLQIGVGIVAALNVVAGFLPLLSRKRPRTRPVWIGALAAGIVVVALLSPAHLFRGLFERSHPSAGILHYKEGRIANVVVYDFKRSGYKDLHLNAVEEASSRLWHVQLFKMLGLLPPLLHEDPSNALMIAFGAGMSAGACCDQVPELTCVDLNPDIDGVAEVFKHENLDVIHNPKLKRVVNDGRNALLLSPRKYPLIISDATNPKMVDSWTLYSREFYELVRDRLEPGGIFCQWVLIPLPGDAIKVILNTFRAVFPHMSFWAVYGSSQCLMLGTPDRLSVDVEDLRTRLEPILDSSGLREFGVDSVEKFLSFFMVGEDGIDRMLAGFEKISTDDLPHAQFQIRQDEAGIDASIDLVRNQESILPYLKNVQSAPPGFQERLSTYASIARRLHLGFLANSRSRYEEAAQVAADAGWDDPNVQCMLNYGPQRKRYFQDRVARFPDEANAHNWLGFIAWKEGDNETAIRELRTAIAIKPVFAHAHGNLARVLMDVGDYDAAVSELLLVRRINPTKDVLRITAMQLEIVHILRKLHYQPDSAELHRALGAAYYEDGQLTRSIAAYRKAVAIGNDPATISQLAQILERHEFVDGARDMWARLAELKPADSSIRDKHASYAALANDPAMRRAWENERLRRIAPQTSEKEKHPKSCDRALALWLDSDFEGSSDHAKLLKAAKLYEKSIARHPDDLHAYVDAATIYEVLGNRPKALALWRGASKIAPDWSSATLNARRIELLEAVERPGLSPQEKARMSNEICMSERTLGDIEKAVEAMRSAVQAAPDQPALWENLAEVLIDAGLYEEAMAAADRAIAIQPGSARALTIRQAVGGWLDKRRARSISSSGTGSADQDQEVPK